VFGDCVGSVLGTPLGPSGRGGHFLGKNFPKGHEQDGDWSEIMDWMHNAVSEYRDAILSVREKGVNSAVR